MCVSYISVCEMERYISADDAQHLVVRDAKFDIHERN